MEFLKNLFEDKALTYEQFAERVSKQKIKLVDLSSGEYVDKRKYDEDVEAKDTQINTLNTAIQTRDNDLKKIRGQLSDAGIDESKLSTVLTDLSNLQAKYDNDTEEYKEKLSKQAYEFAVKEFANEQKFTSGAAKRDFIRTMIEKGLTIENDKIMGANDFLESYKGENADSFVIEDSTQAKKPNFTASTAPQGEPQKDISKMTYSEMVVCPPRKNRQ